MTMDGDTVNFSNTVEECATCSKVYNSSNRHLMVTKLLIVSDMLPEYNRLPLKAEVKVKDALAYIYNFSSPDYESVLLTILRNRKRTAQAIPLDVQLAVCVTCAGTLSKLYLMFSNFQELVQPESIHSRVLKYLRNKVGRNKSRRDQQNLNPTLNTEEQANALDELLNIDCGNNPSESFFGVKLEEEQPIEYNSFDYLSNSNEMDANNLTDPLQDPLGDATSSSANEPLETNRSGLGGRNPVVIRSNKPKEGNMIRLKVHQLPTTHKNSHSKSSKPKPYLQGYKGRSDPIILSYDNIGFQVLQQSIQAVDSNADKAISIVNVRTLANADSLTKVRKRNTKPSTKICTSRQRQSNNSNSSSSIHVRPSSTHSKGTIHHPCNICKKEFKTSFGLQAHVNVVHTIKL